MFVCCRVLSNFWRDFCSASLVAEKFCVRRLNGGDFGGAVAGCV